MDPRSALIGGDGAAEPMSLDASLSGQGGPQVRVCQECGARYAPKRDHANAFCGPGCRQTFNNRRLKRGAEFYDLYMAFRFERPLARTLNVLAAMNRLASIFRREDHAERAGRHSWAPPRAVLERHPAIITRGFGAAR